MQMEQKTAMSTTTARMVTARRNTGSKGGRVFLQGSRGGPQSPLLPVLDPNESLRILSGPFIHRPIKNSAIQILLVLFTSSIYSVKREMLSHMLILQKAEHIV